VGRWAAGPQPLSAYSACQELSQAVFDSVVLGGDGSPAHAAALQALSARLQAGFQTPPLELPFTGELCRGGLAPYLGSPGGGPGLRRVGGNAVQTAHKKIPLRLWRMEDPRGGVRRRTGMCFGRTASWGGASWGGAACAQRRRELP
jgi:hypothetical protein